MTSQNTENQVQTQTRSLKKRFGAVAVLTLLAALCVGGTLASTTVQATADNIMSFGDVKTKVVQSELVNGDYVDLEEDQYDIEAPLGQINRRVRVVNTGSEPEYVRVRLDMQANVAGEDEPQDASNYVVYEVASDNEWQQVIAEDGTIWYYYTQPVAPGEDTTDLVKSMELIGNYNEVVGTGGSLVFTAYAEAVQSKNNEEAALPDKGWPTDEASGNNADATESMTTFGGEQ